MKKHILTFAFCCFLYSSILSQNECFRLHIVYPVEQDGSIKESYTDGDSLSTAFFKKGALSLLCDGKNIWKRTGDTYLASYEITIYDKGKVVKNTSLNSWAGTRSRLSEMPEKIVIDKIKGGRIENKQKVLFDIPSITFYRAKTGFCRIYNWPTPVTINYDGKVLIGKKEQTPLVDQKVILKDDKNVDVQTTTTNQYGDFSFKNLNVKKSYKVVIPYNGFKLTETGELIITRLDGTMMIEMIRNGDVFSYELLPVELTKLSIQKADDTELVIKKFGSSKEAEMIIFENIYYDLNSTNIKSESLSKLDQIVNALKQNPSLKIFVLSHTDSRGDDAYNLTLSQNRAEEVVKYFISKGIKKERLNAKGMGETQIANRCSNNVDCSETEHQLNRRTEFKFTKN